MASASSVDRGINLHLQESQFGWSSAVICGLQYPLTATDVEKTLRWTEHIIASFLAGKGRSFVNIHVQYNQLNLADAGLILANRGRDWMPQLGLGVWPDEPPPRLWCREDFTELGIGERPRPLMHQLFQLKSTDESWSEPRTLFWPSGSALVTLTHWDLGELYPRFREHFLPIIEEPSLRCFPYYFPMLKGTTLPLTGDAQSKPWLSGIRLYIRQSPEDGGVFIWCEHSLRSALHELGFRVPSENPAVCAEPMHG